MIISTCSPVVTTWASRAGQEHLALNIHHWLPQDVAKGIGGLLGVSTSQASSNRNVRR